MLQAGLSVFSVPLIWLAVGRPGWRGLVTSLCGKPHLERLQAVESERPTVSISGGMGPCFWLMMKAGHPP